MSDEEESVSEEDGRTAKLIELAERKVAVGYAAAMRECYDRVMMFGSASAKISWSDVNDAISFDLVHPEGFAE